MNKKVTSLRNILSERGMKLTYFYEFRLGLIFKGYMFEKLLFLDRPPSDLI